MEKDETLLEDENLNDDLDDIEEIEEEEEEVNQEDTEDTEDNGEGNKEKDPKPQPKKKQTAGERKAQAEARRKREEKARQEAEDKAYRKGVIQGLGGINPYTNEKIEDDIDYELYIEMQEAEKKGFDPTDTVELNKYRKSVKQEEAKQREAEEKSKLDISKDIEDFSNSHKDVNVNDLLNKDERFMEFANGLLGEKPTLSTVYDKFNSFAKEVENKAKEIAMKKQARENATDGSLEGNQGEDLYTLDQIKNMSREEIDKNFDKVQKSMDKYYN